MDSKKKIDFNIKMKNVDDILLADNSNEGILRLVMNNTNNKNSLSTNLIEELRNKISSGIKNDDIKVIIIAANGGVFSSGHDLKEITEARKTRMEESIFIRNYLHHVPC